MINFEKFQADGNYDDQLVLSTPASTTSGLLFCLFAAISLDPTAGALFAFGVGGLRFRASAGVKFQKCGLHHAFR